MKKITVKMVIQKMREELSEDIPKLFKWITMKLTLLMTYTSEVLNENLDILIQKISPKDHTLSAKFDSSRKLLSRRNTGFVLDGKRAVSLKQSRSNVLAVAPSGVGKSQVVVFPSLINIAQSGQSMLVNDPHGELVQVIPYLKSLGYKVQVLDFEREDLEVFYNPLLRCTDKTSTNKVANLLVKQGLGNSKNISSSGSYFTTKATELVGMMINFLREQGIQEYYHLAGVFDLLEQLQGNPDGVKGLFDTAPDYLQKKLNSFMGTSTDTLSSIVSTSQASLSFIGNDDKLSYITSKNSIDFNELRSGDQPTAIFVKVPIGDAQYFKKIVGLLFEQFFSFLFKSLPTETDKDVFVVLDEMAAIAPALSDFSNVISSARKFRAPILGILQSENQLYDAYGQNQTKTILNNFNVKLYFSGLYDEADRLEKFLGKYSYSETLKNGHQTTKVRSLMTSDEIRNIPLDQILCIASGMKPLKLKVTPAHKQPKLLQILQMTEEPTLLLEGSEKDEEEYEEDAAFADFGEENGIPLLPIPKPIRNEDTKGIPPHKYAEKLKEHKNNLKEESK